MPDAKGGARCPVPGARRGVFGWAPGTGHRAPRLWLRWAALAPALLALLFPFLVMLSTAAKPASEVFRHPPSWLPEHPAPGNFAAVWSYVPLARYFLNSLIIAGG